ncbi:MAG: YceI family protein [Proteobacteria bacterium]|nr:YceI family protein [Pseudomonadota bacterium]MBU1583836.1 YceI family protein [Pseudomonadota bacterium]MBU2453883.1 YceI family protein [Pseudomonadota bacterium]MBU2628623.1 YceI family protein [Pseudomonadota bacterium]
MKKILITAFFLFLTAFSGTSQANHWILDPDHSEVRFEIQHIFSTISGRFSDFKGELEFNPENLGTSRFDFSVAVKSINTLNNKRDTHLRSKDFFDAGNFPVMTFTSSGITHLKDNLYALEGKMKIKDVTKPLKIQFFYYGPKQHPFDDKSMVAGFSTSFVLNRLDYHVGNGKFLSLGVVGDAVRVEISLEGLRKK